MESTIINIKKIDHFVIVSSNIEASIDFYSLLGFQCQQAQGRYEFFLNDFKINVHLQGQELFPNATLAKPGTLDMCFEVENDLDTILSLLKAHHYEVSPIATKNGVYGVMNSCYTRDPDGNLIELCVYQK